MEIDQTVIEAILLHVVINQVRTGQVAIEQILHRVAVNQTKREQVVIEEILHLEEVITLQNVARVPVRITIMKAI